MRRISKWYGFDVRERRSKKKGSNELKTSVPDDCSSACSINSDTSDEHSDSTESSIEPPAPKGRGKKAVQSVAKSKNKGPPMKRRRSHSGSADDISETGSERSEDSVSSTCSEDTVVKKYGYLACAFEYALSDNRVYQVTGVGTSEHEGETYVVGYRKRYNGNTKYLHIFFLFL